MQQAVGQVIAIKFEMEFEDSSYGFRPNRNAQQAVLKAQEYINSGYHHFVDIDLKSFFDEVDHCILLQLLYRKVKCPLTMRLIRKWLRAPILIKGKLVKQGGALRKYPVGIFSERAGMQGRRRTTGKSAQSAAVQHHVE